MKKYSYNIYQILKLLGQLLWHLRSSKNRSEFIEFIQNEGRYSQLTVKEKNIWKNRYAKIISILSFLIVLTSVLTNMVFIIILLSIVWFFTNYSELNGLYYKFIDYYLYHFDFSESRDLEAYEEHHKYKQIKD